MLWTLFVYFFLQRLFLHLVISDTNNFLKNLLDETSTSTTTVSLSELGIMAMNGYSTFLRCQELKTYSLSFKNYFLFVYDNNIVKFSFTSKIILTDYFLKSFFRGIHFFFCPVYFIKDMALHAANIEPYSLSSIHFCLCLSKPLKRNSIFI